MLLQNSAMQFYMKNGSYESNNTYKKNLSPKWELQTAL
jgi:hypothetical protein